MENNYVASQKFVRMTPRKLRLVADSVRKLTPAAAVEALPYSARFAADPVKKVIQTAIANARAQGADETQLVFQTIEINEGPVLKRGIPVSRGQWHPIKKRMSHIRVVLTEKKQKPVPAKIAPKAEATERVEVKPKTEKKVKTAKKTTK